LNKRNIIVGLAGIFTVLLLGIVIYVVCFSQNSSVLPSSSNSEAITVPDDYATISLAVSASSEGDTILVKEGTYVESVTVDKTLTIKGENKETTVVDGNNIGPAFLIKGDNVKITGFKIRNVANPPPVSDSRGRLPGVHLLDAHGCVISENVVAGCGKGVWIYGGSGNTVSNNAFSSNNYGILIERSGDNFVSGNNASNGWGGIWLFSSGGNKLRDNNMLNNTRTFGISGEELSQFVNDIDLSNMVNDKKVYYLLNKESLTIDPVSFPDLGALILVNCKDVTVQNLDMQNNHVGVHMVGAVNSTITYNAVGSNTVGIWLQFSRDCVISRNNVTQNTDCGVRVDGSNNILVLENDVEQNGDDSQLITMVNSNNSTITGNTLENRLYYSLPCGIYLESSNYTNINNNSQTGTNGTLSGIVLKGSSHNLIQSNTFTDSAPGIWIQEDSNYNNITENTFSTDNGSHGVSLYASYFNELSDNIINNFHTGLELSNAENNIIARNAITSKDNAVQLFKFNNNTFQGNQFYGATGIWDSGEDMGYPSTNIWK